MKLRLDEYYYIISDEFDEFDEFDEIEGYMPQYMVEELDKFRESHTPRKLLIIQKTYIHIQK